CSLDAFVKVRVYASRVLSNSVTFSSLALDRKMNIKSGNKSESRNEDGDIFKEVPLSDQNVTPKLKAFTFAELESATENSGFKAGRNFRGIGMTIVVEGLPSDSLVGFNDGQRPDEEAKSGQGIKQPSFLPEKGCLRFSLAEIHLASQNFDDALILGKGGFGNVYQGLVNIDNVESLVAIKRLNSTSSQGALEFWTEIQMLSKFRHCHLVSLIGYCDEQNEMILVYEYMCNGTLADHLHKVGKNGNPPLSWVQRLKICIGSARGLDYLHTGTGIQHRVIHRDVKSSNILLDEHWAAKVSDFGLSKIGPANQSFSYVSTNVKSTHGYLDPEYFRTYRLTRKTDVYAFGVVLFEVLSGRPAVDARLNEKQLGLAAWARRCVKDGKVERIVDPNLREGRVSPKSLGKFVKIADRCLRRRPEERPTMAHPCFRKFSFAELKGITKNFSMDLVLGEGGFGMTFKGAINEVTYSPSKVGTGMVVAVKRFNTDLLKGLKRGQKPEVAHFQKLIHPNLVKLFGYCLEDEEFLLVYEYMKHGSLDNYLFKDDADAALPWATRLKIAIGAAQGLAFLHTITKQLVYFDFKASNVLLDKDFNAKLCDFGLAELDHLANNNVDHEDVGSSYSDTRVYPMYSVAPEYLESDCVMIFMKLEISDAGEWNMKRDVHGFGFILMQLLTRQKIDRKHTPGSVDWAQLARIYLSNEKKLVTIMDDGLEHKYPSRGALEVAELTLKCLEVDPEKRPSMKEVLETLERISAIKMETMKEEVRG
ncbi:hypothetical protein RJ640_029781, partial [Escallonia rubra]